MVRGWVRTCAALLAATACSAAPLTIASGDGGFTVSDGATVGTVTVGAWDTSWQYTSLSAATNRQGRLPGSRTSTLKLPGKAAGNAEVFEALAEHDGVWYYTVEARVTAATELNNLIIGVDLPLARFGGTTVRSARSESTVALGEAPFGTTLGGPLLLDLGGGQTLLVGPTEPGAMEVFDSRKFQGTTVGLRVPLAAGKLPAGAVVRKTLAIAAVAAGEAQAVADRIVPQTSYDPSQPAFLVNDDGTIAWLGPQNKRRGVLELAVHGREWSYARQGEQPGIRSSTEVEGRWFGGLLPVPRTADATVGFEEIVVGTAGGGMSVIYHLTRDAALPLNSHQLSWNLPLSLCVGRTIELVGEPARTLTIPPKLGELHMARAKVSELRLWPDQPDGLTIQVKPATALLVQDNRQFGGDSLELRFEFGGNLDQPLPAGKVDLQLNVKPASPHQVILSTAGVTTMSEQADWAAYTLPWDDFPVDVSFLNDAPAGKHGFLTRQGDRFVFEDGTEARFWGTCFSAGANFPTHEQADKIAARLAKAGVNIVRTHHADADWADPDFFAFGDDRAPLGQFHPQSIDRFDYLVSRLRAAGIYIYLDQLVNRQFRADEGVDAADQLERGGKPYSNFDPKLIELQKQFSRLLLNHVNPYTGLAYKDDPAVVLLEFANENDLMTQPVELEPYRTRLEAQYLRWCAAKGIAPEPTPVRFDISKTSILQFLVSVQRDYYVEMTRFFRDELGVKVPLTGSNWSRNAGLLVALDVMDFTDSHAYHNHPAKDGSFANRSYAGRTGSMMSSLSFNHVPGKPFFVSEWDTPWPNEYRAELPLWIAAVSAFQGWDGLTTYTYRHNASVPVDSITGAFETFNDPARFGLFPAAALLYRRGDVSRAKEHRTVVIPPDRAVTAPSPSAWNVPALGRLPEQHRATVAVSDARDGDAVAFDSQPAGEGDILVSDTGELTRHLAEQGYGTIDTPRSQAAYGWLGEAGPITLADVTFDVRTPYATVAVSSLTDAPIKAAEKLLLTAVGRAENAGFSYDLFRNKAVDKGRGPILIEPLEGTVSVALPAGAWQVIPIAADGSRGAPLAAGYADGKLTFALPGKTIYGIVER